METKRTVGEIVAERLGRARVLEKYGIDYCCGGGATLEEACRRAGCDADEVLASIQKDDSQPRAGEDTRDWSSASLAVLCDHIESTHHDYMREAFPRLEGLLDKVIQAHGENHPQLKETGQVFQALREEISSHLQKEEQVLFPLIKRMEEAGGPVEAHCGSVGNPIGVMEQEHDNAGDALRRIRDLNNDYQPPEDACMTYQALLDGLSEMEQDLLIHIHKENNILHPRALDLENPQGKSTATGREGKA